MHAFSGLERWEEGENYKGIKFTGEIIKAVMCLPSQQQVRTS